MVGALLPAVNPTRPDTANGPTALDKVCLALWVLFLLAVPFYVMGKEPVHNEGSVPGTLGPEGKPAMMAKVEGGVPQIADYTMVLLMALVIFRLGLPLLPGHWPVAFAFGAFVAYVAAVNL